MTLFNNASYPAWYRALRREVMRRAHNMCEVKGCCKWASAVHHLYYPIARRDEPRDLMAVCEWHHYYFHYGPAPANDNEEDEQLELKIVQAK